MTDWYIIRRMREIGELSPEVGRIGKRMSVLVLFFELIKLLPVVALKFIIDSLVEGVGSLALIGLLLGGYLTALIAMSLLEYASYMMLNYGMFTLSNDLSLSTLRKLLSLDVSYHERNETGVSMNKLIRGQEKVKALVWELSMDVLPVAYQTLFTLIVLFVVGTEIGIAFLFFIPLFLIITYQGAKATQTLRERYHRLEDEFSNLATQSVMNIRTVKDFANERKEYEKSRKKLKEYLAVGNERTRVGMRNFITQEALVQVARTITLALAVWLMIKGEITAGSLVLVMTLSEKVYINVARLYRTYFRMQDAEPSIDRFHELFAQESRIKEGQGAARVGKGTIALENVTFSYDGTKAPALAGISFDIAEKRTIALVGRSGSGKSTLVKLLFRHMDPQQGTVRVGDRDAREYTLANLRSALAIVSQDVELFNESVHENIAYGKGKASRAQVVRAAKLANAHGFITRLPQGYETLVGERGIKLSGGQKQRLAIARALLRDPKILVFDEATSSLDAESEKEIHDAIFALHGKLTLIIIAHRFSTIEHAEQIILLENGKIAEVGTHAELVDRKGIFARLRRLQELGDVQ